MFRDILPRRSAADPLHWTDHLMTGVRALVLLVALVVGWRFGMDHIGPAWFGVGLVAGFAGGLVGFLLAGLLVYLLDSAAWVSAGRQEAYERARAEARTVRAAQVAQLPRNTPPAQRTQRPPAANRQAGPGGPGRQQRQAPAGDPRSAGAVVDDRPVSPAAPSSPADGDAPILVAVARAVTACGHRGARKEEVLDRLPSLGFGHVPRQQVMDCLGELTSKRGGYRLSAEQEPGGYRYFDPAQLEVTDDRLALVTKAVTAGGTESASAASVESALIEERTPLARPLIDRALRILVNDLVLIEHDGEYLRAGR